MIDGVKNIHFLGICGTAMGAVAAALAERGITVTGSDESVYPPMSTFLEERGIKIMEGYRPENIPADAELIVIGNAMQRGNPEVEEVLNRKLYYLSLPEILKEFFLRGRHNLVVAGTHGKTTTTSMLTWLMKCGNLDPGYMIGGIAGNLGQGACLNDSRHFVIEGDEYDTAFFDKRSKFVHYLPELVIVNNIEFDHADIFDDLDAIKLSFSRLLRIVPKNGMVLLNADDENCVDVGMECPAPIVTVGFSENAANRICNVEYDESGSSFELFDEKFQIPQIGEFNVRNAAMAISAAHFYQVPVDVIREGLKKFEGIRRRQEIRGEVNGITIIDDFGHHPTAINQTLTAMKHRYSGRRLWAIFEPRSNTTRRAVFQDRLPEAFQMADGVMFSQVAKLDQIAEKERLDPERVIDTIGKMGIDAYYEPDVAGIVERMKEVAKEGDVIIVFSNGGFDGIHDKLLAALG